MLFSWFMVFTYSVHMSTENILHYFLEYTFLLVQGAGYSGNISLKMSFQIRLNFSKGQTGFWFKIYILHADCMVISNLVTGKKK